MQRAQTPTAGRRVDEGALAIGDLRVCRTSRCKVPLQAFEAAQC